MKTAPDATLVWFHVSPLGGTRVIFCDKGGRKLLANAIDIVDAHHMAASLGWVIVGPLFPATRMAQTHRPVRETPQALEDEYLLYIGGQVMPRSTFF